MGEWQPIETAPRDGRIIILAGDGSVYAGAWNPAIKGDDFAWAIVDDLGRHTLRGCCEREDDERVEIDGWRTGVPTHWMPLPAPPNVARCADE